jgi:predicted DNA-binding mobile mystery protein A
MVKSDDQVRLQLDTRFERVRLLSREGPPTGGFIRAIRTALGMSGRELGERMGVSQSTVTDLEASEVRGTIQLDSLHRAADALDCDLVYFLIPRTTLALAESRRVTQTPGAKPRSGRATQSDS